MVLFVDSGTPRHCMCETNRHQDGLLKVNYRQTERMEKVWSEYSQASRPWLQINFSAISQQISIVFRDWHRRHAGLKRPQGRVFKQTVAVSSFAPDEVYLLSEAAHIFALFCRNSTTQTLFGWKSWRAVWVYKLRWARIFRLYPHYEVSPRSCHLVVVVLACWWRRRQVTRYLGRDINKNIQTLCLEDFGSVCTRRTLVSSMDIVL